VPRSKVMISIDAFWRICERPRVLQEAGERRVDDDR
jgi:hypothetical protein